MTQQYKCLKRLTTDNETIHEVGEVVDLNDDDAKVALRLKAVEVYVATVPTSPPLTPVKTPTPSTDATVGGDAK